MKKLLLFSAAIAVSASSFAQSSLSTGAGNKTLSVSNRDESTTSVKANLNSISTAKTTATSDTFYRITLSRFMQAFDTGTFYLADAAFPADSGAYFGTNVLGASAFAEWFNFGTYGGDTTVKVIGALAWWGGTVQPNSTKTINIKMWNVDAATQTPVPGRPNMYLIETPGTQIYSQPNIMINTLKIDTAFTTTYFTTPQTITGAFFLGYDINYNWANMQNDTLGLYSTRSGYGWGHFEGYVDTSTVNDDTLVYAQTARLIGSTWQDVLGFDANMSIVPIFVYSGSTVFPSTVTAVVKNGLSLYGNYPNPATNSTNIKISLDKTADVTVKVMDVTGRTLSTITESKLGSGEHIIPVSTANFAAGNYLYMITTSTGAALAAQFTVTK